jgi:isopentenyl-diphosphate delta-isomerase
MPETSASTLIDVLDESGRPVGATSRQDALDSGLPVRTVHVFLVDHEGRLLLQRLGSRRDRHPGPGLLGSSVAAFPRPGESEEDAARRRSAEELGLGTPLDRLGTIRTMDGRSPKYVTLFVASVSPAQPRILEPGHVDGIEYWALDELDHEVALVPERFTETFRAVYAWWRERPDS